MSIKFNPIYGQDELIKKQVQRAGSLYFATDTGHIYLDTDEQRVLMGGSGAAVLYAFADNVIAYTDGTYGVSRNDLEDKTSLPKAGDLIINQDGRFFKVSSYNINSNMLICKLIAVSGSDSDGPDSPSDPSDDRYISVLYHDLKYSFLYSAASLYTIDFTPTAPLDSGKNGLSISYTVRNDRNNVIDSGTQTATSGDRVSLPIGRNMSPDGGYHAVDIEIRGTNSYVYTKTINRLKCIDLKIETDIEQFVSQKIYSSSVSYYVKIYGQTDKQLKVYIDDTIEVPIANANSPASESGVSKYININCLNLKLEPGVHTITAYLIADGVSSNVVATDFIYHPVNTADATYIIITKYPDRCWSYEIPTIEYWVYDTSKPESTENTIIRTLNNISLEPIFEVQKTGATGALSWHVAGLESNIDNLCKISCNGASREVKIYCDHSAIFDQITDDAMVLLGADGRTNTTSLEQRLTWQYTNDKNETIVASLKDFNWYNNGWCLDNDGRGCLRISNGASVEIPLSLFKTTTPDSGGFTLEFEFNPYNLYSYNLLQQSVTTVEDDSGDDDKVEIIRTFDTQYAVIKYTAVAEDGSDFGLCCGTQDAFFRLSNGDHAAVRYLNNSTVNVAVTVNAATRQICMYVNGVMSGMSKYKASAEFPIFADKLLINSQQCDLDLYNIRIYNYPLSSQNIVQNYIASKKDLDIYSANQFATGSSVTLTDLITYNTEHPTNTTIPYIIFKTKAAPDILPYNKDNADVMCDIEFVNPALDYALSTGAIDKNYYKKHAPSFVATDIPLNVQGTSSQKYPRKNFKGKFKKATSWKCTHSEFEEDEKTLTKFSMRDNIAEKTFTWKADYMDSSSAHNTGFISYVQELYWNHPLDYYEKTNVPVGGNSRGQYWSQYRTSLFGFPVLAFHEKSDGSTEFIGRYNFNLDKGADDTLGMALDKKHPYVSGTFTEENDDGSTVEKPMDYAHVCECWEMANNMGGRCSYRGNPFDYGYDYKKKKYVGQDADGNEIESHSDLGDDLEVRYHINGDAIEGAWLNLDKPLKDGGTYIGSEAAFNVLLGGNEDGTCRTGAYMHLERFFKWLNECFYAFDLSKDEDQAWVQKLLNRNTLVTANDSDYKTLVAERKAKFENEFDKHLNKEYCMVYYIMTELLIQFDSRGKNMMFASWGPMEQGGEYIWFPIYYDVDTQLGVNNSGIPSWEYNVEPTTGFNNSNGAKAFSTSNSLLWMNFHASFVEGRPDEIRGQYRLLRGNSLTIAKLNGYYDFSYEVSNDYCMKGILPINVMNANQYYKYIAPSDSGYIIGINDDSSPKIRKTDSYFYCLQGTRELHRAQFLRNRFNYYDSKWMAGDYNPNVLGSGQRWRANAFNSADDSLDSNLILNIKPALDQYIVVWLDEAASHVYPIFARGGSSVEIDLSRYMTDMSSYTQQLLFVGGPDHIQEYGNVSRLYLDEFEYSGENIVKIELGNNNPNYRPNASFKTSALDDLKDNKPLLKVLDITNISDISTPLTSLDLKSSIKLEEFKALGTSLTTVDFADGVNLQKLYLPNTLTRLDLKHAASLDKIVYNASDLTIIPEGKTEPEQVNALYIDSLITAPQPDQQYTNIGRINLLGGSFDQYSYELLEKIVNAKKSMMTYMPDKDNGTPDTRTKLAINLEEVHWTPYTQLGEGAIYNSSKKYYYANNNATYSEYGRSGKPATWENDLLNGRVYEYKSSSVQLATSLNLLDEFIKDNQKHFTNISTTIETTLPIITGELYIDNREPISEAALFNIYKVHFPNLNIRVANVADAKRARFVTLIDNIETEVSVQRFGDNDDIIIIPPALDSVTTPLHYDCIGWSYNGVTITDFDQFDFSDAINNEYVFYAVFDKHRYHVEYRNEGANLQDQFFVKYDIKYNEPMRIPTQIPMRSFEESKLDMVERISFKGWTLKRDYGGIQPNTNEVMSQIVNPATLIVDRNYVFYAVFMKQSVYSYDPDVEDNYFNFINTTGGYAISLKPTYQLSGKVTLPTMHNNKPVVRIATNGFKQEYHTITHIFWSEQDPNNLLQIDDGAFNSRNTTPTLIHVQCPNSVIAIGKEAFYQQSQLVMPQLPTDLETIGESAFTGCSAMGLSYIGNKVTSIGSSAFSSAIAVDTLTIGDSVVSIGSYAFQSYLTPYTVPAGKGLTKVAIGMGIKTIGTDAFASRNLTNPHFNTLALLTLNVPVDSVTGAPWGASSEAIQWN